MKWIKRTIFVLFAGFLILGAFLQLHSIRERAKNWLTEKIESSTGYSVQIDGIHLFPSFQLTARNVMIKEGDTELFTLDHVHLGIYPFDLLLGKLHFSTLHIEGVNLNNIPKEVSKGESPGRTSGQIAIDELIVEKVNWSIEGVEPPQYPINLKGNLIVDLEHEHVYSNFKVSLPKSPEEWIAGDFNFEDNNGSLVLQKEKTAKASLEFSLEDNGSIVVPRLFARWEAVSVDGRFVFTNDGEIKDSVFFIVVDDLSQSTPVSGTLFGEAVVSGNIEKPGIELYLISDRLSGYGQAVENFKLRLSTVEKGLFALNFLKNEQDYTFTSALTWDQETPWFPTQLDLRVPLEQIAQLANWDVAEIDGQLLINARYKNQSVSFRAELLDGLIESFNTGSRFTDIQAVIDGDMSSLQLKNLTARDTDNGIYQGSGQMELDPENDFPFSFSFKLNRARPLQSDIFKSTTSGELSFSGTLSKASLEGDLRGYSPLVRIPEKMPESIGAVDVTYINQPEGETPPTQPERFHFDWPVELDIDYTIVDGLTIRGGGLTSTWSGKVNIGGSLDKPRTKGEIKLDKGRYLLRGKTFEFVRGAITFSGDPEKNTNLYLSAEMDLTDLTIQVVLNGPILNPSITLTSNPPMSQRAILSWLLFGKGISEINPMEETQLSRSLRSLLDKVDDKPDVLTRVGDVLGLDQVEIGASPTGRVGDLTVKVGKYVAEDTYITISRNISRGKDTDKDTSCFGIETKLGRHFRVRAEGDTETNGRLNLLWKNDY